MNVGYNKKWDGLSHNNREHSHGAQSLGHTPQLQYVERIRWTTGWSAFGGPQGGAHSVDHRVERIRWTTGWSAFGGPQGGAHSVDHRVERIRWATGWSAFGGPQGGAHSVDHRVEHIRWTTVWSTLGGPQSGAHSVVPQDGVHSVDHEVCKAHLVDRKAERTAPNVVETYAGYYCGQYREEAQKS